MKLTSRIANISHLCDQCFESVWALTVLYMLSSILKPGNSSDLGRNTQREPNAGPLTRYSGNSRYVGKPITWAVPCLLKLNWASNQDIHISGLSTNNLYYSCVLAYSSCMPRCLHQRVKDPLITFAESCERFTAEDRQFSELNGTWPGLFSTMHITYSHRRHSWRGWFSSHSFWQTAGNRRWFLLSRNVWSTAIPCSSSFSGSGTKSPMPPSWHGCLNTHCLLIWFNELHHK